MKTAMEMREITQTYVKTAAEQTRKLLTSWLEHQVADAIDTAATNMKFSVSMRIPSAMTGQNDYIKSYLEDYGYLVRAGSEMVSISWLDCE